MTLDDLSRVELRLLVAFNALIEERSVTRAAERLELSQPALSRQLRQLRQLFADELFTRHSHGLIPTPRAEQLHHQLHPLLDDLLRLVSPVSFAPESLERTFRIGVLDPLSQGVISALLGNLQRQAPGVSLRVLNLDQYSMDALVAGQLDFILTLGEDDVPANIHARVLVWEMPVCMVSCHHPLAAQGYISREQYLAQPHVDFWIPGFSDKQMPDWVMSQRQIVLETNNMMTALNAVCNNNMVMLGGDKLTRQSPRFSELVGLPFSVDEKLPVIPVRLLWHSRYHEDAAHQWLRELIDQLYWK
ncbi:MAG: LysR family transcriptional regulator [Marinobacterium sp.]|nr:LysR family transcriptional regulator [Marinobacterium sp.]